MITTELIEAHPEEHIYDKGYIFGTPSHYCMYSIRAIKRLFEKVGLKYLENNGIDVNIGCLL
jgi:hypothetical protein